METVRFAGGFTTRYSTGAIKESVALYDSNSISFSFFSGKEIQTVLPAHVDVNFYNSQFGISVTQDGRYFFILSWKKNNLFCFRIADCKKMWTARIRHPYGLYVCQNFLICYAMHDGVYKIAIDKGTVISHFQCTYTKSFYFLSDTMFFIGPLNDEYIVMDFDFRQLAVIPVDVANPLHYDTFIVKAVTLSGKSLILSGTEYNSINLHGLTYLQQDHVIENSQFRREIELSSFYSDMPAAT